MDIRRTGLLGGAFGFLAVALGAFAAHALRGSLAPGELATFETGVRYQMYHALALLLVAALARPAFPAWARTAALAFTLGILIFSGSLYLLVLAQLRWMGAITPIGGVAFLVGWSALIWGSIRRES